MTDDLSPRCMGGCPAYEALEERVEKLADEIIRTRGILQGMLVMACGQSFGEYDTMGVHEYEKTALYLAEVGLLLPKTPGGKRYYLDVDAPDSPKGDEQ